MQASINIVILNWNGYNDTSELLESLFKITYSNYKIIVVDNNSENDELEKLKKNYSDKVQIIPCKENLGYAGGNNVGIKFSFEEKADFVLLLNNDTTVEPNFLEPLVNKIISSEQIGITAPQINYFNEPHIVWSAGGKISWLKGSGFAESNKMETEADKSDKQVSFVSGCCMLVKREVFLNVGLFDENYFLYNEDSDLCLRTLKSGYEIYISPQSKIYHKVNSSTEKKLLLLPLYYTTRNRLYFAKKNFRKIYYLTFIYIFTTMAVKSLVWMFTGRHKNIFVVKNAIKDYFSDRMGKTEHNNFFINR